MAALAAIAACWPVLLCPIALGAEGAAPPVAELTVENNYLLGDEQVLDALGLRVGRPLHGEQLADAARAWNESGLYGTVSYRVEPAPEGRVGVIVSVAERVALTEVRFRGNERFSDERLAELTDLEPGTAVTQADVRNCERRVQAAYGEQGFASVAVRGRMTALEPGRRELTFYVNEGPRTCVEAILFEGNEHLPSEALRDAMETAERGWPSWIWPGWFDPDGLQEDVRRVEAACRDRGYLDARAEHDVAFSDDMRRATVRVTVREGPFYTVAEVTFEGNTLFTDSELLAATPFVVGEPYRLEDLEVAAEAVSGLYAEQGHWDVTRREGNLEVADVIPAEGADVSVRFVINEGEPVYVRRIHIRGLTRTKESVVRRNLTFYPGELASAARFEESERALVNTGYFDRTKAEPVEITLEPDAGTLRDAVVRVDEGPTGRLLLTAGVGSESGLLGGVTVEEDNFDITNWPSSWSDLWRGNALRGGGQRLSLTLRAGTERSYYAIGLEDPAVRNTEYSLGGTIYSRGIVRQEWDETRTGVSVTAGEQLSPYKRRSVTVGYENIDVDDTDPGDAPQIRREDGSHSKPFVRFRAEVDRRDDRFIPTDGYLLGGEIEVSAGDVEAVRLDVEGRRYWTVREERGRHKHVVAARGRVGVVDSYSGRVPVYERLYAGGFSTLRGFQFEGVAPSHGPTGDLIGGESMVLGSVEYSVPISRDDRLRALGFCDAGWVSEDVGGVISGLDELRIGLGLGLRWEVPQLGGAIELDLAVPVARESDDETQSVHFSFGAERRF
jgi:outer membrane protein insertion porin family